MSLVETYEMAERFAETGLSFAEYKRLQRLCNIHGVALDDLMRIVTEA